MHNSCRVDFNIFLNSLQVLTNLALGNDEVRVTWYLEWAFLLTMSKCLMALLKAESLFAFNAVVCCFWHNVGGLLNEIGSKDANVQSQVWRNVVLGPVLVWERAVCFLYVCDVIFLQSTQEYATEALAEMLVMPYIQVSLVSLKIWFVCKKSKFACGVLKTSNV